jgi:hypothetical protein
MDTKTPSIGLPATLCVGSDCYPGSVVAVSAGKSVITFKHDRRSGDLVRATLRKDGTYRPVGCKYSATIRLGEAEYYMDPHF